MLKRISKKILIALIALLMVPLVAKADMGAPEMISYKVVVSDKDGINFYDWQMKKIGTIPVDEVLEINWEEYKNDVLYGSTEYKGEYGFIKLSDTKLFKDELTPDDVNKDYAKVSGQMYVFDKGAKLYKGPSFAFDTVMDDDIEVGTTIKYTYKDDTWLYTEYKGKKGWVYHYSYITGDNKTGPLANIQKGKLLTLNEVTIYEDVKKEESTGKTIPAGKEVSYKYSYYPYPKTFAVYVEYDGTEGWVFKTSNMGESDKDYLFKQNALLYIINDKEYTVYKDYNQKEKVDTIKGSGLYKTNYTYYHFDDYQEDEELYYIEYKDGKYGWVKLDYDEVGTQIPTIYETKEDTPIYSSPSKKDKADGTIKKGKQIKTLLSFQDDTKTTWVYVKDDDYEGWVSYETLKYIDSYEVELEDEVPEDPIDPAEEKKKKKEKEDKEDEENSGMSTMQIVVIAVAAAIILAFTTVIIIVLINMKKGKIK